MPQFVGQIIVSRNTKGFGEKKTQNLNTGAGLVQCVILVYRDTLLIRKRPPIRPYGMAMLRTLQKYLGHEHSGLKIGPSVFY